MATVLENMLAQYPKGEKCGEFVKELQNVQSLSWQDIYWKVKYAFHFGFADIEPAQMIKYCNSCFTQGLTVSADKAKYMDARAMLARLYVISERYDMCVNCIQAMLDITEDLPADVFLDLTEAELHTEALRMILRNSKMFFKDLHTADNHGDELKERQKKILRNFLTLAGNYLSDHPDEKVDTDTIQREVTIFGLTASKEWKFFNDMKNGGTIKCFEPITPTVSITNKEAEISIPEDKCIETPPNTPKKRPFEIPISAVPTGEKEGQSDTTSTEMIVPIIEEIPVVPEVVKSTVEAETSDDIDSTNNSENSDEQFSALSPDMVALQEMLRSIQEMVAGNCAEIKKLKRQRTAVRKKNEDASGIEAQLVESERKSKELQERLAAAEGALATSEAQKRSLATRIKAQDALLEKKKAMEFTEDELVALKPYSAIIIFDTCSIMNYPNILDYVRDGELVVVPKQVNEELEKHKTNHYDDRQVKARRAIDAIFQYKRKYPITYADHLLELIPEAYRAEDGTKEINDNKILSVAIRYRRFSNKPVYFVVDDKSLSNKASGEDIDVYTGEEFTEPEHNEYDEDADIPTDDTDIEDTEYDDDEIVDGEDSEAIATVETRNKAAQEDFLAQKISASNLKLEASSISFLQNNGVKTIADFLSHTEESFSQMRSKKGIPYPSKWVKVQESLRRKLETLKNPG